MHGFTLLELMVALTIIGIITVVAIESWRSSVLKGERAIGVGTLIDMQLQEEKWRASNITYGTLAQVWGGVTTSDDGYYLLAIPANSATGYTLTATGQNGQQNDAEGATSCATLTITVAAGLIREHPPHVGINHYSYFRSRTHFVAICFSPRITGVPPCNVSGSTSPF